MNILIANPKKDTVDRLRDLLIQYDDTIKVVGNPETVAEAVDFFKQDHGNVDLAFINTSLSDGSSFDIFDLVSVKNPIVFTSVDKHDAFNAFKANGIDYLLEPVTYSDISQVLKKVTEKKPVFEEGENELNFYKKERIKKRFIVKIGDKIQFKTVEDISYFYADGKFVYLVSRATGRKYIIEYTMDELEKKYLNPEDFYRINRKYIVNIESIDEVRNYANSRLKLMLNPNAERDMIVSRDKVNSFKKWLNL